jgi:hypothetical protein
MDTQMICEGPGCICSSSGEECCCIPAARDREASRCLVCGWGMHQIDIATGEPAGALKEGSYVKLTPEGFKRYGLGDERGPATLVVLDGGNAAVARVRIRGRHLGSVFIIPVELLEPAQSRPSRKGDRVRVYTAGKYQDGVVLRNGRDKDGLYTEVALSDGTQERCARWDVRPARDPGRLEGVSRAMPEVKRAENRAAIQEAKR